MPVFCLQTETTRIPFALGDHAPSLQRLVEAMKLPIAAQAKVALQYVDVEGDVVTIASDRDVHEAIAYMKEEGLEELALTVQTRSLPQQLQEMLTSAVMAAQHLVEVEEVAASTDTEDSEEDDDKEEETKPVKQARVGMIMTQFQLRVQDWPVEDALKGIQTDLLTILGHAALQKMLEEVAEQEEFAPLVQALVAATMEDRSMEDVVTDKLDVVFKLLAMGMTQCPELKPVVVRVVKACGVQLEVLNTRLGLDSMPALMKAETETVTDLTKLVHTSYQCDACKQMPIRGIRYCSTSVANFDLCLKCFASAKYAESHGPFDAITEYKSIHYYTACDGCNMNPITGVRFKSTKTKDFDLCEKCEATGRFEMHEPFIKMNKPARCPWGRPLTELVEQQEKEEEAKYAELVHSYYECDGCKELPIRGIRYHSTKDGNFDLCSKCYRSKQFADAYGPFDAIKVYKPVHFNITCDGCEMNPITGVRYKSIKVNNFDLCETCEASGRWVTHEPFIKISTPERCPWEIATHFEPPVQPAEQPTVPPNEQQHVHVHPHVTCDGCGMNPLVGLRYKSKSVGNFDLCEVCKNSGQWDESHGQFVVIENTQDWLAQFRRYAWDHSRWGRMNRHHHHHHGRRHGNRGNRSSDDSEKPGNETATTIPVEVPLIPPTCVLPVPRMEPTLSSKYIRDVSIFDGEKVAPDTVVVKAWRIQNNGETEWPLGCMLKMQTGRVGICPFESQGDMMDVPVPTLAPGDECTVEVKVRTPSDPGRCKAFWRMCDPSGKTFGHRLWMDVDVTESVEENSASVPNQVTTPKPASVAEDTTEIESSPPTEDSEGGDDVLTVPDAEELWKDALGILASMGFEDVAANRQAIVACDGDVLQAINLLLLQ